MPARATRFPSPLIRAALAACLALLPLAACGGGDDREPADTAADAAAPSPAAAGAPLPDTPPAVQLTERDVEQYIAAMRDLNALGTRVEGRMGDDPGRARQMAEGIRTNAEARAILGRHGFDVERFYSVSYSVWAAAAASQLQESEPQRAEALKQLEEMKGKVPAEQYEAMRSAMQGAAAMTQALGDQPEANVRLVARYREQLEGLSGGRE